MEKEIWRAVEGYNEKYFVEENTLQLKKVAVPNKNDVSNQYHNKEKICTVHISSNGYPSATLNGLPVAMHVIIAKTFPEICGKWFEGCEVHHKDYDKLNYHPENLIVLTKEEHKKLHSESEITKNKRSIAFKGRKLTEEHIEKLKKSHIGIKQSDETKLKKSQSLKKYYETHNKEISIETRNKISETLKGKYTGFESSAGKPVNQYTIDGILIDNYGSARDAAVKLGLGENGRSGIKDCLGGRQKTAYGFVWKFA